MTGEDWNVLAKVVVSSGEYQPYTFPSGFSAHWVRVVASSNCTATAYFHYT